MGMRINFDKPITAEERVYLEMCNRHREITENDARFRAVEEEEEEVSYADWTNEELREELKLRELSTEGKKAELVQRLEEHDAATE